MMHEHAPTLIVTDQMIDDAIAVVKSVFPNATDEQCGMAAAGALMAAMSAFEDGNITFAYSEDGPVFRWGGLPALN